MAAKTASLSVNIIADAAKARAGLKEAETAFGKFSREVGNAQGAMGKFQAIGNQAFAAVKANAVAFATGAAAAIGTFVVKSVLGFQDLALSAGKFSDATGLSTQQASRFIEVAGDIGVEAASVEKSIGFMNKTLGNSPDLFRQLGVEIERTSSGATDVNGTFLNVVKRLNEIEDPAQRGAAATKLLGRGWMELAELIGMGADDLAASLASVSEAKVIDPKEVAQAKALREETEKLKDAWDDFANTVGQTVIPVLTDLLSAGNVVVDAINKIPFKDQITGFLKDSAEFAILGPFKVAKDGVELVGKAFDWLTGKSKETFQVTGLLKDGWMNAMQGMVNARYGADELSAALLRQVEDVDIAKAKWDEFRNGLSIKQQSLSVVQSIEEFRTKWAGATDEAKAKSREYQADLLRNQAAVAGLALQIVGLATTAQNTRIRLLIETGQLQQAWSLIQAIQNGMNQLAGQITPDRIERQAGVSPPSSTSGYSAPKTTTTTTAPKKSTTTVKTTSLADKLYSKMASGGTVVGGGLTLVGEKGPELLNLPRKSSVVPSIPTRKMMGTGQMIVNIQVQAGLVSSPDQVGQEIINAIRRAERRSGQVFASV